MEKMADEEVKSLLKSWNLNHLIDIFESNSVDKECMLLLGPETIKELCPTIGDRLKLSQKIDLLKKTQEAAKGKENQSDALSTLTENYGATWPYFDAGGAHTENADVIDAPPAKKSRFQLPFTIADVLDGDIVCRGVVKVYSRDAHLTDHHRSIIGTQLVKKLFEVFKSQISGEILIATCKEILALFPTEKSGTWYEPAGRGLEKCSASGALYNKVKYLRGELTQMGVLSPLKRNTIKLTESLDDSSRSTGTSISVKLDRLRQIDLPYAEVSQLWEETRDFRFAEYASNLPFVEALRKYPLLTSNFANQLIETDCKHLYGDVLDTAATKWPTFVEKLSQEVKRPKKSPKVIKIASRLGHEGQSFDQNAALALQAISLNWPHSTTSKRSKKLSAEGVGLQLIDCAESQEDALAKWNQISCLIGGLEPRPLIYCLGGANGIEDYTKAVVVIGGHCFDVNNILEGVILGLCVQGLFKCSKYLDITSYIWAALDKVLLGIDILNKKSSNPTSKILSDLRY